MARKITKKTATQQPKSKKDTILALLRRKAGASIKDLIAATGWQAHSVRGFLSGTIKKKLGLKLSTEKLDSQDRRYFVRGRT